MVAEKRAFHLDDRHDEYQAASSYPAIQSKAYHHLSSSPSQRTQSSRHIAMASISPRQPETHFITQPTPHVPNSRLPVLIYRSVLPAYPTPETVSSFIEPNNWIKGGVFKHYPAHHFHSVTHELYAVFKGHSRLLLGRGPLDGKGGVEVELRVGDCIVLPAGVAHCCRNMISSTLDPFALYIVMNLRVL